MKTKKVIKLINDERLNARTASEKGCEPELDYCLNVDAAHCINNANDFCGTKDLAACSGATANDVCFIVIDIAGCIDQNDYT